MGENSNQQKKVMGENSNQQKKVVLLTGASSGIGLATANSLHKAGYEVYGTSRKGAGSGRSYIFSMVQLDVTDDKSVAKAVSEVLSKAGRIDVLVNNAGIALDAAATEESSIEQAESIFNTNYFGTLRMIKAVLPIMREQKGGRIINIGSIAGVVPVPFNAIYSSSKFAIESLTESLDREVRDQGIRVSVIEPGLINTEMLGNFGQADSKLSVYEKPRVSISNTVSANFKYGENPQVIADTVLTSLSQARPHIRYAPGKAKWIALLHYYAPTAIFSRIFERSFGLQ